MPEWTAVPPAPPSGKKKRRSPDANKNGISQAFLPLVLQNSIDSSITNNLMEVLEEGSLPVVFEKKSLRTIMKNTRHPVKTFCTVVNDLVSLRGGGACAKVGEGGGGGATG